MAWDKLPAERKKAATIKCGGRVFTAAEIDRLHHKPSVSNEAYLAELVGVQTRDIYGGPHVFPASNDGEAIVEAQKWARCQTFGEPVRLTLTHGYTRRGVHSEMIDPAAQ